LCSGYGFRKSPSIAYENIPATFPEHGMPRKAGKSLTQKYIKNLHEWVSNLYIRLNVTVFVKAEHNV
jgi:hypothetical protein